MLKTRIVSFINQKLMNYTVVMRISLTFVSFSTRKLCDHIYLEDALWRAFSFYDYFYTLMYYSCIIGKTF